MSRKSKKYQKYKPNRRQSKRPLLITLIVVLVLGLIIAGYWLLVLRDTKPASRISHTSTPKNGSDEPKIDLSPPTPEEKKSGNDQKEQVVEQQKREQEQVQTPASGSVTPVITQTGQYGGTYEILAHVNGVVEDGGACTLTATLGSYKVSKTVQGARNAQNTSCPVFEIPRPEFAQTGKWKLVVAYNSSKYSGTSQSVTMEVK